MIEAINVSPRQADRLTAAIQSRVNSTGDIQDIRASGSGDASPQAPTPSLTAVSITTAASSPAASPTPSPVSILTPPATVVVHDPAVHPATAPVQQLGAAENPDPATTPDPTPALPVTPPQVFPVISPPGVPSEHHTISHGGVTFLLPLPNVPGPYYLITKGRLIGVVAKWFVPDISLNLA